MSFTITITETRDVTKLCGKQWLQVGEKEVERDHHFSSGDSESKTRIESVFGYTPEIEKRLDVKRDVLIQEVDELDLIAVIKAINAIG